MLLNKREKLLPSFGRPGVTGSASCPELGNHSVKRKAKLPLFASFGRPGGGFAAILAISVLSLAALSTIGATVLYAVNRKNTATADLKRNHAMMDVMELLAYSMQEAIEYIPPGGSLTTLALGDTRAYVTKDGLDTSPSDPDDLRLLFSGTDVGCVEYDSITYCAQYYRSTLPTVTTTTDPPGTPPPPTTTIPPHPPPSPEAVVSIGVIDFDSLPPYYCDEKQGSQLCRRCQDENTQCIDIVVCKNTFETRATGLYVKKPTGLRNAPCGGGGPYYVQTVLLDMEELGLVINANPDVVKVGCNDYPSITDYYSLFDKRIENPYSPQIKITVVPGVPGCLKKVHAPPSKWDQGKYYVMTEDFCFEQHPCPPLECRCGTPSGTPPTCNPKTCSDFGSGLVEESAMVGTDEFKQNCYDYVGTKCMFNKPQPQPPPLPPAPALVCYLHTPNDVACAPPACTNTAQCAGLVGICNGCTNLCDLPSPPGSGRCNG